MPCSFSTKTGMMEPYHTHHAIWSNGGRPPAVQSWNVNIQHTIRSGRLRLNFSFFSSTMELMLLEEHHIFFSPF